MKRRSRNAATYGEWAPSPPLKEHLCCLWLNDRSHAPAAVFNVVPDGCVDVIWTQRDIIVAGPDTRPVAAELPTDAVLVGARFHPGAALSWLGIPLNEILNSRLPLREFWKSDVSRLADALFRLTDPAAIGHEIERTLVARLSRLGPIPQGVAFLRDAAFRNLHDGHLNIPEIAGHMGLSERTLHRRCTDVFGYGLKTLHRILRFQRFRNLALHSVDDRLVEIAFEAGYADQAHLTREVRRLGGLTPAQYLATLRDRSTTLDFASKE